MKINKDVASYIHELEDVLNLNLSLGDMFSSLFSNYDLYNKEEIEVLAKSSKKDVRDIYLDKILDYWEIDLDYEDNNDFFNKYINPSFIEESPDKYLNNPYFKNIKINNIKDGDYELKLDSFKPYEIFALDDIRIDEDYVENSKIAYFRKEFPFITLNYKKVTWMNITPNEINTMEKGVGLAKGDVIVYGLGLGYFPYMISLKDEVKSITIIEKDKRIINLFNKYIFPQFKNQNKIKIIEGDALKHNISPLKYDFAFVDLWHNPDDGIDLYLKFKKVEKESPNCTFVYWLDTAFEAYLRRAMIYLLVEQLNGFKEDSYHHPETYFDKIICSYYFKTKNITLNKKSDVDDLLKVDTLINLLI